MTQQDYTALIGPLNSDKEWPMYSYERPAYMFWNAIANTLRTRGWSDEEIKEWLQSKEPRWMLDGELGETIEAVAAIVALGIQKPGEEQ